MMDKHGGKADPENDDYKKANFVAIGVKRILDKTEAAAEERVADDVTADNEETKGYYTTFRINDKTKFDKLLEEACKFWGIKKEEYELIDETESQLQKVDQSIDRYFKNKQGNFNQYLVFLRKRTTGTKGSHAQNEATKNQTAASDSKTIEPDYTKHKRNEIDQYEQFFKRFPGLKSYIDIEKVKDDDRKKEVKNKKHVIDTMDEDHCTIFTLIVLLLIFTIVPLTQERSIISTYYTISSFQKAFGVSNDIFDVSTADYTFDKITNNEQFYNFMKYTISTKLFYVDPSVAGQNDAYNEIIDNNILIAGVRLRQMRVQSKDCGALEVLLGDACYYEKYTEKVRSSADRDSSLDKTNWEDGWAYFKTASELGQKSDIKGKLANYDGSGYTIDVPWQIPQAEVTKYFEELQQTNYIDSATRALVVTVELYNINGAFFIYVELLIEVSPTGILLPTNAKIVPFRNSFHQRLPGRPNHLVYDVLRGLCAAFLLLFVLFKLFCEAHFQYTYFFKFQGLLNGILIILSFISIGFNNQISKDSVAKMSTLEILQSETIIEMRHLSGKYEWGIIIMGILSGVAIIRAITILRMNSRFFLIIVSLEKASKQLFFYTLILAPLVIGFTIAAYNLFGPNVESYNTFAKAFISMLLFGLGQISSDIFSQTVHLTTTIIFFTIYYFFVVFFLITVFAGIYIDSYRLTVMEYGYNFIEEDSWTMADLIAWVVPKLLLNKVKLIFNSIKKKLQRAPKGNKTVQSRTNISKEGSKAQI